MGVEVDKHIHDVLAKIKVSGLDGSLVVPYEGFIRHDGSEKAANLPFVLAQNQEDIRRMGDDGAFSGIIHYIANDWVCRVEGRITDVGMELVEKGSITPFRIFGNTSDGNFNLDALVIESSFDESTGKRFKLSATSDSSYSGTFLTPAKKLSVVYTRQAETGIVRIQKIN